MSVKTEQIQPRQYKYRGQSLIEMALLLPFLLVLILGGVDIGRLFFAKTVVTNAAREGAYYLSTHPLDYDADAGTAPNTTLAAVQEASNSGIPDVIVTVRESSEGGEGGGGGGEGWGWEGGCDSSISTGTMQTVEVTVQTNVANVLVLSLIGNLFSLEATSIDEFPVSSCVEMLVP